MTTVTWLGMKKGEGPTECILCSQPWDFLKPLSKESSASRSYRIWKLNETLGVTQFSMTPEFLHHPCQTVICTERKHLQGQRTCSPPRWEQEGRELSSRILGVRWAEVWGGREDLFEESFPLQAEAVGFGNACNELNEPEQNKNWMVAFPGSQYRAGFQFQPFNATWKFMAVTTYSTWTQHQGPCWYSLNYVGACMGKTTTMCPVSPCYTNSACAVYTCAQTYKTDHQHVTLDSHLWRASPKMAPPRALSSNRHLRQIHVDFWVVHKGTHLCRSRLEERARVSWRVLLGE